MAGRPKYYTDEELIDRATKVFWEKGYAAASAKDLLKGMDIGQGSFYRSFPGGKKELYQKTLLRFVEISINDFYADLDKNSCPIKSLKDFFFNVPMRSASKISNGCYLGNSIVELSNLDEETMTIASNLLKKLKDGFETALKRAQEEGKLSVEKSPQIIALHLINLWNGINVTQRMDFTPKQLKEVLKLNLQILD